MGNVRLEYVARERKRTLDQRYKLLEKHILSVIQRFTRITPSTLEVALRIPEVLELIQLPNDELEEKKLEEMVQKLLPEYKEKRFCDARSYFQELVRQDIELDESTDPLSLAVGSLFSCNQCKCYQSFPEVLGHGCLSRRLVLETESGEFVNCVAKNTYPVPKVWSKSAFRSEATKLSEFVRAYGLDPRTATATEMDAAEVRLKCIAHSTGRTVTPILTWRSAVRHCVFPLVLSEVC